MAYDGVFENNVINNIINNVINNVIKFGKIFIYSSIQQSEFRKKVFQQMQLNNL